MENTNETIKMAEKPKKESAIKTWFRDNKEELIKVAVSGLFAFAGGLLIGNQIKKSNRSYYSKGYHDAMDWATFGCDWNKTIAGMDYEYAGYGEFHDCDPDMADALLKHAESLGLGEDRVKTIKQVIFMEMDKNLPSSPIVMIHNKN